KASPTCPPAASLAVGETTTCTATHSITQADVDNGSLTNHANAHTSFNSPPVNSPQATATVTAVQAPALKLYKSASPTTYSVAGQPISYTYVVKNIGNVDLAGPVTITDDKASPSCPPVASLAVGATTTCTATYLVTQNDVDTGTVTNHANAH